MHQSLAASSVRQRSSFKRRMSIWRRRLVPYTFLTPFYLLFLLFLCAPLVYAFYLSLFTDRLVGGTVFSGIQNYLRAFRDGAFWEGVGHMLLLGIVQIPLMLGLALIFSFLIDAKTTPLRRLFRIGFFLPYAIPSVIAALLWGYLYGPSFGLFTQIEQALHLPTINLLNATWILPSIGNIVTWQYTGYNMIIIYAALQSIPPELTEAACVDGANAWQIATRIKIPLLAPAIILTGIFSIIGTLQLFNEPQILSTLAPTIVGDHYTPSIYAYSLAFSEQEYNYSAAISFVLALIAFCCSSLFMYVTNRRGGRS